MASIDNNIQVTPVRKTVNPEIKVKVWLKLFGDNEIPVSFSGCLIDSNDIRIASLSQWEIGNNTRKPVSTRTNNNERNISITLYFRLTKQALEHIEVIRDQNENKDIPLQLKFNVGILNSKLISPNIQIDQESKNLLYKGNISNKSSDKLNLLASQSNGKIVEIEYRELAKRITIPSSDWAQNYCPALGIGRFATVDLYIPEFEEAETELDKYLNDAIQTVQKMEKYVHYGEWSNVIEESRKLSEVLRARNNKLIDQWKEVLNKSGYQDDALDKFYNILENLYQFSSKFVHRIDFNKNLRDQIKVEKEDAYFIYTTSIGLVNLLSRKVQEFKKSK